MVPWETGLFNFSSLPFLLGKYYCPSLFSASLTQFTPFSGRMLVTMFSSHCASPEWMWILSQAPALFLCARAEPSVVTKQHCRSHQSTEHFIQERVQKPNVRCQTRDSTGYKYTLSGKVRQD